MTDDRAHELHSDRDVRLPALLQSVRLERCALTGQDINRPIALIYRVRGDPSLRLLSKCLVEIVRRHEPLRAKYVQGSTGWVCELEPASRIELEPVTMDLSASDDVVEVARCMARDQIDIRRHPLLRVLELRKPGEQFVAVLSDHSVMDGVSSRILASELLHTYRAKGSPAALPPLPISFFDFADTHRTWVREHLSDELAFWRTEIEDSRPYPESLRNDACRKNVKRYDASIGHKSIRYTIELSADTAKSFVFRTRSLGLTPFMAYLASFVVSVAADHDTDVGVTTVSAARSWPNLHLIIGDLANSIVLRIAEPHRSFDTVGKAVLTAVARAMTHDRVPFGTIVREVTNGIEWHSPVHPLVSFQLHEREPPIVLPDGRLEPVDESPAPGEAIEEGAPLPGLPSIVPVGVFSNGTHAKTISVEFSPTCVQPDRVRTFVQRWHRVIEGLGYS